MPINHIVSYGLIAFVALLGLIAFARFWRAYAPSAGAPTAAADRDENADLDWPDTARLWSWYASARICAAKAGTDRFMRAAYDAPFIAAQAIGQAEGARLRAHPDEKVPLLTAEELDAEVTRLLIGEEAAPAESASVPEPATNPKGTGGLWRKSGIKGGKYLVTRRDGTAPEWPSFVLGARDPAAPDTLRFYANVAESHGFDPQYVKDVRTLADEFDNYRVENGAGDPDARPHRQDDPQTVVRMEAEGNNA